MFEISFGEVLIISLVALVVLGPERLPAVVRTFGVLLNRMQRFAASVKADMAREAGMQRWQQWRDELHTLADDLSQEARLPPPEPEPGTCAGPEQADAASCAPDSTTPTVPATHLDPASPAADSVEPTPAPASTPPQSHDG